MNLSVETPAGMRRAALTLHALGEADRAWLLERLAPEAGQVLRTLIDELRELGIPANADVIRAALSEAPLVEAMAADEARALAFVLAKETPALQGLFLAALDVGQREAVIGYWPDELHARPSAVLAPAWTPALRGAILDSWRELAHPGGASA